MTGFINVNKAPGASSAKEVTAIKKLSGMSCGHMGTLDPLATGVLPVAIGNAARLFEFFLDKRKVYRATFLFGTETDTLDTTGEVLRSGGRVPSLKELEALLCEFTGQIEQVPPKYSAKSIKGKRGYQLARAGIEFELPPKKVNIYSIRLLGAVGENSYRFEIECGGGTYIRSIARDLGAKCSTVAVMSTLERTKSGPFEIQNSVSTEALTPENFSSYIIPTENVIDLDCIYPSAVDAKKLFNGQSVECGYSDGTYKIYDANGGFYGLAEVNNSFLKVRTKLC